MIKEGMRCVLYVRVSTEMQVDGYSLDGQRNILKRYAEREGMIIKEIYEDAGKSGKSIDGRPAFQRLLKDISNGLEIDYILVYKLSRFGRNAADILTSIEYIQSYDINLIATEEGIDSSQTSGKLLISVLSAVSEIERENILEQTMNGRREKARQGGWNGGFAPYGYKLENGELKVEPDEARQVKLIFDMFANTSRGLNKVAMDMNARGETKKIRQNGTLAVWTSGTIKRILDNPVYIGKIAYGRRAVKKVKGTRNQYVRKTTDDYLLCDGKHEAIIDEETWNIVQNKRDETGVESQPKLGHETTHLLSGILKCPCCGGGMTSSRSVKSHKDTGEFYYYYNCKGSRYAIGRDCTYRRTIREEMLNYFVIHMIPLLLESDEFSRIVKSKLDQKNDKASITELMIKYKNTLRDINNAIKNLEDDIDSMPSTLKNYAEVRKKNNERLYKLYDDAAEVEEKVNMCEKKMQECTEEETSFENIKTLLLNYSKLFEIITVEEKRKLLKFLFRRIDIYENYDEYHLVKSVQLYFRISSDQVLQEAFDKVESTDAAVDLITNTGKKNVYVELNFEELGLDEKLFEVAKAAYRYGYYDRTKSRGPYKTKNATYKEIQAYVLETYGFKIHTAHIAELKRAYGCDMYDAPNRVEKLKHPFKHTTKEKYEAIRETLIHFNIIGADSPNIVYVENELDKFIALRTEQNKPANPKRITYQMIKDYVMDKYKFKVHTQYIAEVKRKNGIDMQSVRMTNGSKYPCPPDKVLAIEDALKYYKLLH